MAAKVLLIVPPFHTARRPSIAAGLLKAALASHGFACDVLYVNLRFADIVGLELYSELEDGLPERLLVGEWLFAGDLFSDRAPDPRRYVDEVLRRYGRVYNRELVDRLLALRARVPAFLDEVMDSVAWGTYGVVGATSTFQQNCAALALLQRIKRRSPRVATIMGGGNCEGQMGAAVHELFPFVDYVCSGEGDRIFPVLVRKLLTGEPTDNLPGILARAGPKLAVEPITAPMVLDLDRLPYPDYDDYFAQLATSGMGPAVRPSLAFETARGCWWGEKHHCTFCGVNGERMKYRSKSHARALEELDFLVERYGIRELDLTDEILDLRYFDTFLKELAGRDRPPSLFYETKANLTKDQLRRLAWAGARRIQPGIESFSTPILRLMDKGVTGLQNVRLLKWCAEIGIRPTWNILVGFPGEDPREYERMAKLVPSLTHLEPPVGYSKIRLDRFSPNFYQAEAYGFVNVRAFSAYGYVYPFAPADLDRLAYTFDYDYADGRDPRSYVGELRDIVTAWQERRGLARLELRDDGDRLELRDSRPVAARPVTILHGPARLAYLALDAGDTARGVQARLQEALGGEAPSLAEVDRWLEAWLVDRLIMREGPRHLSLATNPVERVPRPARPRRVGMSFEAALYAERPVSAR